MCASCSRVCSRDWTSTDKLKLFVWYLSEHLGNGNGDNGLHVYCRDAKQTASIRATSITQCNWIIPRVLASVTEYSRPYWRLRICTEERSIINRYFVSGNFAEGANGGKVIGWWGNWIPSHYKSLMERSVIMFICSAQSPGCSRPEDARWITDKKRNRIDEQWGPGYNDIKECTNADKRRCYRNHYIQSLGAFVMQRSEWAWFENFHDNYVEKCEDFICHIRLRSPYYNHQQYRYLDNFISGNNIFFCFWGSGVH